MALRDRLRPWHGVMLVVFVAGAVLPILRHGAFSSRSVSQALLSGLFGVVLFQFTVGNVWGYAVEYHNAGGGWTDAPFLTPFLVAGAAGVTAAVAGGGPVLTPVRIVLGAWVAFWVFVVVAAVVSLAVWMSVGYRDALA